MKLIMSKIMTAGVGPDLVSKYSSKGSFMYNLKNKMDTCSPKFNNYIFTILNQNSFIKVE